MSSLRGDSVKLEVIKLDKEGMTQAEIGELVGLPKSSVGDFLRKEVYGVWWGSYVEEESKEGVYIGPKILVIDIETSPILGAVWSLWKQNVSLNMIKSDWYILSYCAKWYHRDEILYEDKKDSWETVDDLPLLESIHALLDEADIVVGQNSIRFDTKKINARFIQNGLRPPKSYRQVDTMVEAKKYFNFTSNKLEYLTDKLCKKYKKLKHAKFSGFELWSACLKGDPDAWAEMQEYNCVDVLATEELYEILRPWMKGHPNINLYNDSLTLRCVCGSEDFSHSGYHYTNTSKFDKFKCDDCGAEVRGKVNLIPKDKRVTLMSNII